MDSGDARASGDSGVDRISAEGAPLRKRARISSTEIDTLKNFSRTYPHLHVQLSLAYTLLQCGYVDVDPSETSDPYVLHPLKIEYCNCRDSLSFTECFCAASPYNVGLRFYHTSKAGCDLLFQFLKHGTVPDDCVQKCALYNLVTFFIDNCEATLHELHIGDIQTETDLTIFLMYHLIAPLSVNKTWAMDLHYMTPGDCYCPCARLDCRRLPAFRDTSIGHVLVWHGSVDTLTDEAVVVGVQKVSKERSDEETTVEVKLDKIALYGQSIVNSFLQKKVHPELSFVPALGLMRNSVKYVCMILQRMFLL